MVKKFKKGERENSGNETGRAVWFRLHWFKVKPDPRLNWTEVRTWLDGAGAGPGPDRLTEEI